MSASDSNSKAPRPPGELLICELCGQQPESIAFDPDGCRDDCLFKQNNRLSKA